MLPLPAAWPPLRRLRGANEQPKPVDWVRHQALQREHLLSPLYLYPSLLMLQAAQTKKILSQLPSFELDRRVPLLWPLGNEATKLTS